MAQHGKIAQVIGPVVDVRFDSEGGSLPEILDALEINNGDQKLILEVQKHIGEDMVRAIALVDIAVHDGRTGDVLPA